MRAEHPLLQRKQRDLFRLRFRRLACVDLRQKQPGLFNSFQHRADVGAVLESMEQAGLILPQIDAGKAAKS